MPRTGYFAYFAVKLMQQQQQQETGDRTFGMRYEADRTGSDRPGCLEPVHGACIFN